MTKSDGAVTATELQFLLYGTVSQKAKSGAYLFLPDGPAKVCQHYKIFFFILLLKTALSLQIFIKEAKQLLNGHRRNPHFVQT